MLHVALDEKHTWKVSLLPEVSLPPRLPPGSRPFLSLFSPPPVLLPHNFPRLLSLQDAEPGDLSTRKALIDLPYVAGLGFRV